MMTERGYEDIKALGKRLRDAGCTDASTKIEEIFETAWTTSSELLAEIRATFSNALGNYEGQLSNSLKKEIADTINYIDSWLNLN
jgi:hypothetical protein